MLSPLNVFFWRYSQRGRGGPVKRRRFNKNQQKMTIRPMKDNSEPERDPGIGTDYSAEEAEQMGAFVEDALSFEDARESVHDMGHTIMLGATGAGKSKSLAELLKDAVARSEKPEQ
jgi:hypothetical protein